jgi:hypothetical protein
VVLGGTAEDCGPRPLLAGPADCMDRRICSLCMASYCSEPKAGDMDISLPPDRYTPSPPGGPLGGEVCTDSGGPPGGTGAGGGADKLETPTVSLVSDKTPSSTAAIVLAGISTSVATFRFASAGLVSSSDPLTREASIDSAVGALNCAGSSFTKPSQIGIFFKK